MNPTYSPSTALDSASHPHPHPHPSSRHDPYYPHPSSSSSSSSSPPVSHQQHHQHHHHHHQRYTHPDDRHLPPQQHFESFREPHYPPHTHHSQPHPHHPHPHPQQRDYPPRPQSPPHHYRQHPHPADYPSQDRHSYPEYPDSYPQHRPDYAPPVRHSEGYEGKIRNTTRDHNDHLMTSDHQHQHPPPDRHDHPDSYRRDPYSKHPTFDQPSSSSSNPDNQRRPYEDDDLKKMHLPPILAPEEPFYRMDLPGRHMRYFRNVTSQDREDRNGYYSSARHVAPSNTSGNFGHGPPIGEALDRFDARRQQQQQHQQHPEHHDQHHPEHHDQHRPEHHDQHHHRHHHHPHQEQHDHQEQHHQEQHHHREQHYEQHGQYEDHRLPSLYSALPEQRPGHPTNASHAPTPSDSNSSEWSSPSHAVSSPHHRATYQQHSPMHSPVDKPLHYNRSHPPQQHQQQQIHGYQSQPMAIKPKAIQPRSIAPAPMSNHPMSDMQQQPTLSPRVASKRPDRQNYVKIEPKEQPYHSSSIQSSQRLAIPAVQAKRKWDRDHSPSRHGPRPHGQIAAESSLHHDDESSQELHLLSRRGQVARPQTLDQHQHQQHQQVSSKKGHAKTKMQRYQMTTIRCWHGAIAQKSYGIEKRYLCPPPMVHVSAGVNAKQIRVEQPHVTMSVIHEKVSGPLNENLMEQDCSLDDGLKCSFRNLHVTGTGSDSSKRFKLGLRVFLNKHATMPTAIMDSNPIPIISKPSKKTAKAGNASCFILNGMSVSLLNRINAQTVRTKYMAVDNNAVCAKIGSWSSFTIKMVKPPPSPPVKSVPASMGVFKAPTHSTKFVPIRMKRTPGPEPTGQNLPAAAPMARSLSNSQNGDSDTTSSPTSLSLSSPSSSFQFRHPQQLLQDPVYHFSNSEPVLYGSEVVLVNDLTGIMTDRLIIRKVENGKVSRSGTGPVSQMQKIVLEHPDRVHPEDGRSYYLSASSIGSPKIEGKIPLQTAMDRSPLLEYRTSSKKASIMDMTDAQDDEEDELNEEEGDFDEQNNSMPRRVNRVQDSVAVDDFVCWTIAGIAKFDYTYFGPIPSSVDADVDPSKVPTVLGCPRYSNQTNTVTMPVKNVFEKISVEEEAKLAKQQEDPYERRLTLSEYVYKRCEDTRQPMKDEEGPIQLWLAQHGPIRMRRRQLVDIVDDDEKDQLLQEHGDESEAESNDTDDDAESDQEDQGNHQGDDSSMDVTGQSKTTASSEDQLPKIATKVGAKGMNGTTAASAAAGAQSQVNSANGRHYGGSHLPLSMMQQNKRVKMVKRPMGLEAELPYACEVRAAHDSQGNAKAELDILMVERVSGIAYRTGYKVVYSRDCDKTEWTIEVVG